MELCIDDLDDESWEASRREKTKKDEQVTSLYDPMSPLPPPLLDGLVVKGTRARTVMFWNCFLFAD